MADYQKMYVILCVAASDAADGLADIPLAMRCRGKLQKALLAAEDIFIWKRPSVCWTVRVNKKYLGRKRPRCFSCM